jgi:hypothetical protein
VCKENWPLLYTGTFAALLLSTVQCRSEQRSAAQRATVLYKYRTPLQTHSYTHLYTPYHAILPPTTAHNRNAFLFDDIYYQMVDRVLVDRQTHDKAVRMSKERVRRGGKDYPNAPLQPERVISTVPKIVLNAYVFSQLFGLFSFYFT